MADASVAKPISLEFVRGALYGVYELLRRLGVKFLAADETLYPTPLSDLPVFNLSVMEIRPQCQTPP